MDGDSSAATGVFDPLTNETRVDILRALARAASDDPTDPWVGYTALRDAVGVRDNGNFNYHLDRLGDFVEKQPAGYRLSHTGMDVVTTLSAGGFDADWTWGPVEAPGDCPFCERPVELRYEDGALWLACGRDDHEMALAASPSLLDTTPEDEVVDRIAFVGYQWSASTRQGVCSECRGHVDGRIEYGGVQPDHYHYRGQCDGCGFQHAIPVGSFLRSHPAVRGFYREHGIDVRTTPFWTLDFCTPGSETVRSTDPLRLCVDVTHDAACLSLTLTEDGSVVETTRR